MKNVDVKKNLLKGVSLIIGLFIIIFISLVVSSIFYDKSNPRARPNSYYSVESVIIERPVNEVFHFIQYEIPSVYEQLSPMHEKFEILNREALVEGAEIDCVEGDDKEIVRNHYVVTEVIENKLIAMSSKPTKVYNRETNKLTTEVDVYDYFDFELIGSDKTRLTQTVVLEMKNPFIKSFIDIIAFISGTRGDWEQQFKEQNENLAIFAEKAKPTD